MGYSKSEKAETHTRIVSVAAKRFRELGLEGIGVADVMKEAGVTVGGFYKHFDSRDELVVEAQPPHSRTSTAGRKTLIR
ncbi:MAG: TetR/AcrR family transcriptional regulator [Candidatus Acidiferrales bacterium]|jgi:TetR/AcrR family transcriptional repressor of nem operon